jgi:hypothetical protein
LPSKCLIVLVEFIDSPNIFSAQLRLIEEASVEDDEGNVHVVLSEGFEDVINPGLKFRVINGIKLCVFLHYDVPNPVSLFLQLILGDIVSVLESLLQSLWHVLLTDLPVNLILSLLDLFSLYLKFELYLLIFFLLQH